MLIWQGEADNTISMVREGFADLGEGGFLVCEAVATTRKAVAQQKTVHLRPASYFLPVHAHICISDHRSHLL